MKKVSISQSNLISSGSAPWHHPGSSPSSLSSGGSVSPPGVDPSPSKAGSLAGILNTSYINVVPALYFDYFLLRIKILKSLN